MTKAEREGWLAVAEEMSRPDFQQVFDETTADMEAGRGRTLDEIEKELAQNEIEKELAQKRSSRSDLN